MHFAGLDFVTSAVEWLAAHPILTGLAVVAVFLYFWGQDRLPPFEPIPTVKVNEFDHGNNLVPWKGQTVVVVGGSGLAGRAVVRLLLETEAMRIVNVDLSDPPTPIDDPRFEYIRANICDAEAMAAATEGADVVILSAALVGPYYPHEAYYKVNYDGAMNVVKCARANGCNRIVFVSSPSTKFDGSNVLGAQESDVTYPEVFLQEYARTKALAEREILGLCESEGLLATSVAPHQVYGPGDRLFFPNFIENAITGRLRIIGTGDNYISMCYTDNIAHALLLAAERLYEGSPIIGEYFVITDGEPQNFWDMIDKALIRCEIPSLKLKFRAPRTVVMAVAYLLRGVTKVTGRSFLLNPFAITMLCIHRYFNINKARTLLNYKPRVPHDVAMNETLVDLRGMYIHAT